MHFKRVTKQIIALTVYIQKWFWSFQFFLHAFFIILLISIHQTLLNSSLEQGLVKGRFRVGVQELIGKMIHVRIAAGKTHHAVFM